MANNEPKPRDQPSDGAVEIGMAAVGYDPEQIADVVADLRRERELRLKADAEEPASAIGKRGVAVFARPMPPVKILSEKDEVIAIQARTIETLKRHVASCESLIRDVVPDFEKRMAAAGLPHTEAQ